MCTFIQLIYLVLNISEIQQALAWLDLPRVPLHRSQVYLASDLLTPKHNLHSILKWRESALKWR